MEGNLWMLEVVVLMASPFLPTFDFPSASFGPYHPVLSKCCHVVVTITFPACRMARWPGEEHREVHWREEHISLREMWLWSGHETSFSGLTIVMGNDTRNKFTVMSYLNALLICKFHFCSFLTSLYLNVVTFVFNISACKILKFQSLLWHLDFLKDYELLVYLFQCCHCMKCRKLAQNWKVVSACPSAHSVFQTTLWIYITFGVGTYTKSWWVNSNMDLSVH